MIKTCFFKPGGGKSPREFYFALIEGYKIMPQPEREKLKICRAGEASTNYERYATFHVADTTTIVDPDSPIRTVEITGREETTEEARLTLEKITSTPLEEILPHQLGAGSTAK